MRTAAWAASVVIATTLATAALIAPAHAEFESCRTAYAEIGLPERLGETDVGEVQERCLKGFALSYNKRTKTPDWVIERLTPASFRGTATRSKAAFAPDTVIAENARAELTDYEAAFQGQRFDRGHQAPAADTRFNQTAMDETFLLSNMAPQVGIGFNRHAWSYLEKTIRSWVTCGGHDRLYVITGPIYAPNATKVLGANKIAIPDAFFKIAYDPARGRAIAFVLENKRHESRALAPHRRSIAEIERLTGIDFLTALPERQQTVLESNVSPMWAHDRSCDMRG